MYIIERLNDVRVKHLFSEIKRSAVRFPVEVRKSFMSLKCLLSIIQFGGCDQVATTALPIAGWGTRYIVPPLYPRQGYMVRIFSQQPTNVSMFNNTSTKKKQLRAYDYFEVLVRKCFSLAAPFCAYS